jgi:NIPSNAP
MLYEMVTVEVRPGAAGEAVKRIGANAPAQDGGATLIGFWTTEIGRVNELVSLWTRADESSSTERDGLAAGDWLAGIAELVTNMRVERFRLFSFMADIAPGRYGGVYELRSYLLKLGTTQETIDLWAGALPARAALSKPLGTFYAVGGSLQKFIHIWPYDSADHRQKIRDRAIAEGVWPPKGGASRLLFQENSLLIPTSFSPLR